ncbi:MAG: hypothetical protein LBP19_02255 [Treponema sp.]|jgi:hypothetical protein|nr:hypothetical protein [Treponema sp.]
MLSKAVRTAVLVLLAALVYNCIHTKSGNSNFNRDIAIRIASGNAYIYISGHISENIYVNVSKNNKENMHTVIETPIVEQGTETINQYIILNEGQTFRYTLTISEVVVMNIRSVDGNDVQMVVSEYGKDKKYVIKGKNSVGRMISFKN